MASPDIRRLYQQFLEMHEGEDRVQQFSGRDSEVQTGDVSSVPTGGVLGPLFVARAPASIQMQGAVPLGYALRPPFPGTRFGTPPGVPTPNDRGRAVGIPFPNVERLVPEWMRHFWTAQSLIRGAVVDNIANGRGQEADARSSGTAPSKPENRSNGLGWYVGPPVLKEEIERSAPRSDDRILQRVDDDAGSKMKIASPPLAPDDPADTEGCDEEWAAARRDCEKGMSGPPGQGPTSKPSGRRGRRRTLEDCMNDLVSARCGGTPRKDGLSGKEAAERNNRAVQKKRGR